jgi:hypothetical protein
MQRSEIDFTWAYLRIYVLQVLIKKIIKFVIFLVMSSREVEFTKEFQSGGQISESIKKEYIINECFKKMELPTGLPCK